MPELSRKEEARRAAQARRGADKVHRLPPRALDPGRGTDAARDGTPAYAELHCLTHFSFQRGASSPEELVRRAWALGYTALAITDECSVAGVVRAWKELSDCRHVLEAREADDELRHLQAARMTLGVQEPLKLLYGSEFRFPGQGTLVALARDLPGWGDLCEFISHCRRAAPKGQYVLPSLAGALTRLAACELLWAPARPAPQADAAAAGTLLEPFQGTEGVRLTLLAELHADADDARWLAQLCWLSSATGWPLAAAGEVHMHARSRKRLQDVLTAIRLGRPVHRCGFALQPNAERHLRPLERLVRIHPPDLLAATLAVAERCRFTLEEVRYNYPQEAVLPGLTPTETLRKLTYEGAAGRYPSGVPPTIVAFIEKELALIADCRYEAFFLTVHHIVRFARSQGILCQGRGSAANSVVCWCLGITAADPEKSSPLLERFISKAREKEPPDIDVDFEHERREEVIQYIYREYGRDRAALAATVICWRTRSALRDVGKALGVDERLVDAFARDHHWFDDVLAADRLGELARKHGCTIHAQQARLWLELSAQLKGTPRHLSQHVGGFVLTETPLHRLVPLEPAAMEQRQVIQWDKDDLEALGLIKVDVLALGMLTAMRRCLDMVGQRRGRAMAREDIPHEDEPTYEMIRQADTVGTFQIESRAQMSMLPRLKPATFYDLVVQVAIVRPGPISGGMVHPYLKARERRRRGEAIVYERSSKEPPDQPPALMKALERTLGVPIFQEQVMAISMIAAGFSATKADELRRAMAAWKRKGGVHRFEAELKGGMIERGYSPEFAERIFRQILGFGEYGFPESHAYSFALIAYESSWLKCHEPEAFLAAMLNSQPMGFYGPSQLIQDARRHGVVVLPPDVTVSDWDSTLEPPAAARAEERMRPAVRLGLRLVKSLDERAAERIAQARLQGRFSSVDDLARRARLDVRELNALAVADALHSLAGHRRQQAWQGAALQAAPGLLREAPIDEAALALPAAPEGEEIVHDYAALGLTLRRHPLALLRERLGPRGVRTAAELNALAPTRHVIACGLVTGRQRPATANDTIFVTLEDETGPVNVIVWKSVRADPRQRQALLRSHLLAVEGEWQCDEDSGGRVAHLIARRFHDLTHLLGRLAESTYSRDFR